MEAADLKKLLDETRRQEEELRKDREALERVARIMNLSPRGASKDKGGAELPFLPNRARSFSDAIREAIQAQEAEFTIREIFEFLVKTYPEMDPKGRYTTISSILGSFKDKHLQVVSSGPGIRSVFRRL